MELMTGRFGLWDETPVTSGGRMAIKVSLPESYLSTSPNQRRYKESKGGASRQEYGNCTDRPRHKPCKYNYLRLVTPNFLPKSALPIQHTRSAKMSAPAIFGRQIWIYRSESF